MHEKILYPDKLRELKSSNAFIQFTDYLEVKQALGDAGLVSDNESTNQILDAFAHSLAYTRKNGFMFTKKFISTLEVVPMRNPEYGNGIDEFKADFYDIARALIPDEIVRKEATEAMQARIQREMFVNFVQPTDNLLAILRTPRF